MAEDDPSGHDVPAGQVDVVVDATRVIGALIARTLVQLDPPVTMPQWRVLVLASDGGCPVSAVADDLAIHPSNATRIVERLASAGLVEKCRGSVDRRQVMVTLTTAGQELYDRAMRLRRERVQEAMQGMGAGEREQLVSRSAPSPTACVPPPQHRRRERRSRPQKPSWRPARRAIRLTAPEPTRKATPIRASTSGPLSDGTLNDQTRHSRPIAAISTAKASKAPRAPMITHPRSRCRARPPCATAPGQHATPTTPMCAIPQLSRQVTGRRDAAPGGRGDSTARRRSAR